MAIRDSRRVTIFPLKALKFLDFSLATQFLLHRLDNSVGHRIGFRQLHYAFFSKLNLFCVTRVNRQLGIVRVLCNRFHLWVCYVTLCHSSRHGFS
jgi:hypothetical protein